jgi:hypothetical protein
MTKKITKPRFSVDELEEAFSESAKQMSLRTQLVDACEWDEERAIQILNNTFKVYEDLYEYSKHDSDLIQSYPQFLDLVRINLNESLEEAATDTEFNAVLELIDHEITSIMEKYNADPSKVEN